MMSKYKRLSNFEITHLIRRKSQEERRLTIEVIEILEEIERRRLFLEMGFSSLMEFCVKDLKYSESAAYRRISAMRLSREMPEIKDALNEGRLNLANVAQAQTLFRAEAKAQNQYSKEEKRGLLKALENTSTREAQKILNEESPKALPRESVKALAHGNFQATLVIDAELMKKLERLKGLVSHKHPNPTLVELIHLLADLGLEKLDPSRESKRQKNAPQNPSSSRPVNGSMISNSSKPNKEGLNRSATPAPVLGRTKIPRATQRVVWQRANRQCTYVDPISKRRCSSTFQLEKDHIIPVAKGGTSSPDNLRLLCRGHNQLMAGRHFGKGHMAQFKKATDAENEI